MPNDSKNDEVDSRGETASEEARAGLALLLLLAQAADDGPPDWVNRRVEQLEFLDTRAVRWRVSIDFVIPDGAPVIQDGNRLLRLVPLTSWNKGNLVAFDLRDEEGRSLWLPTSGATTGRLAAALEYWGADIIREALGSSPDLNLLDPSAFGAALGKPVHAEPAERQWPGDDAGGSSGPDTLADVVVRAVLASGAADRDAAKRITDVLARDEFKGRVKSFDSQLAELARNIVIMAAVEGEPGTRRVLKLSFESDIRFRRPRGRWLRLIQSLGWRHWRLDVLIGARGGSHHLEVASPPGIDIVQISARPAITPEADEVITAAGGVPHVHIRIPASRRTRHRATILVRVSRAGWLTNSFMIAVVITAVLIAGRVRLSLLLGPSGATANAGTAAALLLGLLGVFATMLIAPGEHPLASRLLLVSRALIIADTIVVLCAVSDLVLHLGNQIPTVWWTTLPVISGVITVFTALSLVLPIRPWRKDLGREHRATRVRRRQAKPDSARVDVPAADGYHYGDSHEWDRGDQRNLVHELETVIDRAAEDSPRRGS